MDHKTEKKKIYSKFERCLLSLCFFTGILAACQIIAVLEGAFHKAWETMGVNGYAGRVMACIILTASFVYLAQAAFQKKPFHRMAFSAMTFYGIICVLASVLFCYLPGYSREWFSFQIGSGIRIDGYYLLAGIILILAGFTVRYAAEEQK